MLATSKLMGDDFWPHGPAAANSKVLDGFCVHHRAQGLSQRRLAVEELFQPSTLEAFSI